MNFDEYMTNIGAPTKQRAITGTAPLGMRPVAAKPPLSGMRPAAPARSAAGEILTGLRTGVTEEVPRLFGQALEWATDPNAGGISQDIHEYGQGVAERAQARSILPENALRPRQHGTIVNAFAQGGQMLAPSIGAPVATGLGLAALGAAAPELAVTGLTGLVISSAAGALPMGMQQAQQTYEAVKKAGGNEADAIIAGWKSGGIETIGETAGNFVGGKFVGIAAKTFAPALEKTLPGIITGAVNTSVWKPFAKDLVETALVETGTEMAQNYGEAAVEKAAGVDTNPWKQMMAVVGPTLAMTTFLAPFGLHAEFRNSGRAHAIDDILSDPASVGPKLRQVVVDQIYKEAKARKISDADEWYKLASQDVKDILPVRRNTTTTTENAVQSKLVANTIPEANVVSIKGDQATVTFGDGNKLTTITAPVKEIAQGLVAGKSLEGLKTEVTPALSPDEKIQAFEQNLAKEQNKTSGRQLAADMIATQQSVQDQADTRVRKQKAEKLKEAFGKTEAGKIITAVNENTGSQLRYDGEQKGLGISFYQLTDVDPASPAYGASFSVRSLDKDTIEQAHQKKVQEFSSTKPENITRINGQPFASEAAVKGVIAQRKLDADKLTITKVDGGFIAVPKEVSNAQSTGASAQKGGITQGAQGQTAESVRVRDNVQPGMAPASPEAGQTTKKISNEKLAGDNIAPNALINGITKAKAGDMMAAGDEAVLQHIREGVKKYGAEKMSHNIRNQAMAEIGQAIGRKEDWKAVQKRIAKLQPKIDAILNGTEGIRFSKKPLGAAENIQRGKSDAEELKNHITAKVLSAQGMKALAVDVVQGVGDIPGDATWIPQKDGSIAGAFDPKTGKIILVADNVSKEEAPALLLHEVVHKAKAGSGWRGVFGEKYKAILKHVELSLKAGNKEWLAAEQKAKDAGTPNDLMQEETITYFLQDRANAKSSSFQKIKRAIKTFVFNSGIRTTVDDDVIHGLADNMLRRAIRVKVPVGRPTSDIKYSLAADALQQGKKNVTKVLAALSKPKSAMYDLYIKSAPQWLSVSPIELLTWGFGKDIHQVADFSHYLDAIVAAKTDLVEYGKVLYDETERQAKKQPKGSEALNKAAAVSSFNRMTPWLPLMEQDWTKGDGPEGKRMARANTRWIDSGMKKATGMTLEKAYNESKAAYNRLNDPQLKEAYRRVVEHLSAIRVRERGNLLTYIEKATEGNPELRKNLLQQLDATFSTLQGAYWPLSRVGDFTLRYVDTEGFKRVEHFTTNDERRDAIKEYLTQGVDADTIKESYKNKQPKGSVAIPQMLMGQLSEAVQNKYLEGVDRTDQDAVNAALESARSVVDDMNQIWLRWQPETSAYKNSIHRGNVKGWHEDMLRSYMSYVQRHASNIAWAEQGRLVEESIQSLADDISEAEKSDTRVDTTMRRHILNDLRARIQSLRSVKVGPIASTLGRFGTGYYITSPSIAVVQMSQLAILTLPHLAARFGWGRAAPVLAKWTGKAFSPKYTKDKMFDKGVVEAAFRDLHEKITEENRKLPGAAGKQLGDDLFSDKEKLAKIAKLKPEERQLLVLREAMARNLLDISATHEAYALTIGKNPNGLWAKSFNIAMKPMSLSELASRKIAVLATYELATEGKDATDFFTAMDKVGDVVDKTLYSYAVEHKGAKAQGGGIRLILQFQHYRIMTAIRLALIAYDSFKGETPKVRKEARKEFIGIMGVTGALAGTLGLPMANVMFAALNAILGDDDDPVDSKLTYTNWLHDTFPKTLADIMETGLPSLAGIDASQRTGLANIYGSQQSPPPGTHGKDLAKWEAASLLGPVFSVAQSWFQGYDEAINNGDYLRGLEDATPKPIRDTMKAIRVASEGLKTRSGQQLLSQDQISPGDIILLALGFNTTEISKAYSAQSSMYTISAKISERRGHLIRLAARDIVQGNDPTSIRRAIRRFNRKMPYYAVQGQDILSVVRKLRRGSRGMVSTRTRQIARQYEIPSYLE